MLPVLIKWNEKQYTQLSKNIKFYRSIFGGCEAPYDEYLTGAGWCPVVMTHVPISHLKVNVHLFPLVA